MAFHLRLGDFEGPLDLLLHLIEKNKMDIHDIPMAEITAQYLEAVADLDEESQADFLVMASTLLYIKSRLLLPAEPSIDEAEDPRGELVLQLLAYQRCRLLAQTLAHRGEAYGGCVGRAPLAAEALGIIPETKPPAPLRPELFSEACERLSGRNQLRFRALKDRVRHLLRPDRLPMRTQIRRILEALKRVSRLFLIELLPPDAGRPEAVSAFLALLELVRMDQILVSQAHPFGPLLMEPKPGADASRVEAFLQERKEDYA